ncbi:MAG TPA: DUF2079 domain-containing protein [Roseiflexaceae bacterium]|nr:DUF2079 domain-containing protein [Roseiflexaceae bacterium]
MTQRTPPTPAPAAWLLAVVIAGYIVLFTGAAWHKLHVYLMGFDLAVHTQVIWNTANGRIAATSAFAATDSYLGIDMIPTELLLTPFYALAPAVETLLLLKTVVLALGAVPVYLLVRDRFSNTWAGLAFAVMFLLYHPVEYMNLYEFQIRAFATTFLLAALLFLERRRVGWFWLAALLALGCRSDVGLVLAGMGLYTLTGSLAGEDRPDRRIALTLGVLPIVVGLGWIGLSVAVLVPLFRNGTEFLYANVIYGWLGSSPGDMLGTLLTRPGFVLAVVLSPDRLRYLLEMFLPFAFLLLLQPRMLIITLPIFAMNLLSSSPNIHASTRYHYQAAIIPFMVVGSAYALHWLSVNRPLRQQYAALAAMVLLALVCNIGLRNPLLALATRSDIEPARIAAAERLLAQVPAAAALTTTSTIGPHAAQREQLYFFPGNIIYPADKVELGEYLLIDDREARPEGRERLAQLAGSGRYQLLAEEHGVSLWRRAQP